MSTTQTPVPTSSINGILPVEVLVLIFEEHARLDWKAPAIDGQVCSLWRQIILNAPRAWAYLEIYANNRPSIVELRSWLRRSAAAPLHIRVSSDFPFDEHMNTTTLYDLLCEHHARIASLRMGEGEHSFFAGKDFPSLRHLNIYKWSYQWPGAPSHRWGRMPQLRSLRLGATNLAVTPLDGVSSLTMLILNDVNCASLPRHSPSLTTLMLSNVSLEGIVLGPLPFPSLTYLSLFNVTGLKPHMDAPHLTIYHEGGSVITGSFPTSLQSIVEYGLSYPGATVPNVASWHPAFINISRLSITAYSKILVGLLDSLASHPHVLPALRMICVRSMVYGPNEDDRRLMVESVRLRSEARQMDITLYFNIVEPFKIPLFFSYVICQPLE